MTKITVDAELLEKLRNLSEPLELCDDTGRTLARVIPSLALEQYEAWEPSFTEDELRNQEAANEKRYSSDEVRKHLENL